MTDLKDLLETATTDPNALNKLRKVISPGVTVFVLGDDGLDIDATLEAIKYWQLHSFSPGEWGEDDTPTVDIGEAFPQRVQLDPLKLQPLTGGLWDKLWALENGHELAAAIYWGGRERHIIASVPEIKLNTRALIAGEGWPLLSEVVKLMNRDESVKEQAMDAVYPAVRQRLVTQTPVQVGHQAVQDALDDEYNKGMLDIGRYLRLKVSATDNHWPHAKKQALKAAIHAGFDLEEIRTLAFETGCDPDDLPRVKTGAVRGLVTWADRRNDLGRLSELVRIQRPGRWHEHMQDHV